MPIIGLQRRLREVGRIRLGEKEGNRPVKLDRFRFTAPDRHVIDAVAATYGGEVREWQAPAGPQWEVVSEASAIDVIVPPSDVRGFSQWLELWKAGGCVRRCDGTTEVMSDGPCLCDPSDRACAPTTRLSLVLPGVAGFGVWRVESHGWYAAAELDGTVAIATRAADQGAMIPARLLAEQRMVKGYDERGKAQTFRFVVPVLDLGLALAPGGVPPMLPEPRQALPPFLPHPAGEEGRWVEEDAGGGEQPRRNGASTHLRPVPPASPPAPVEAQVAALGTTTKKGRKPPAHLPPTGLDPLGGDEDATALPPEPQEATGAPVSAEEGRGTSPPPSTTDPEALRRKIMAESRKTWPDATTEERDELRHALGVIATYTPRATQGRAPVSSVSDMSLTERLKLSTLMADVRHGRMTIEAGPTTTEGHQTYRAWLAGSGRVAQLTRRAVDDWLVQVEEDAPQ